MKLRQGEWREQETKYSWQVWMDPKLKQHTAQLKKEESQPGGGWVNDRTIVKRQQPGWPFPQILPYRGIAVLCNMCMFVVDLDLSRLVPLEFWINQQHFFCAQFGRIYSFSIYLLSTDKDDLGTVSYFPHVVYHGEEPRFLHHLASSWILGKWRHW